MTKHQIFCEELLGQGENFLAPTHCKRKNPKMCNYVHTLIKNNPTQYKLMYPMVNH